VAFHITPPSRHTTTQIHELKQAAAAGTAMNAEQAAKLATEGEIASKIEELEAVVGKPAAS